MPSDRLTLTDRSRHEAAEVERAVAQVIAGETQPDDAVGRVSPEIAAAVELYRKAGREAVEQQLGRGWWQIYVQFPDWQTAEHTAVDHVAPLLNDAEAAGLVTAWWFMRKHPCWRLRLRPGPNRPQMVTNISTFLDGLVNTGAIHRWWPGIYEAETAAFGGQPALTLAHDLFVLDSRAILNLLRAGPGIGGLGRRELSILLCTAMLRAAGLEWYEQADVWHRVARERLLRTDIAPDSCTAMAAGLHQLMLADSSRNSPLFGSNGPLAPALPWISAFHQAGEGLGMASRAGTLQRGLREVLSYLVIFHWNRLGLSTRAQAALASAARAAILSPPASRPRPRSTRPGPDVVDLDRAIARFPLVQRAHFRCADLPTRIHDIADHAQAAQAATRVEDRISRACAAWNLAALVAADCALPDLAAELCQRQFTIFQSAWPVSGRVAIAALQPIVNLVRLTARAGNPGDAYRAFEQLNHAVHHDGTATIHGSPISFAGFTSTPADRAAVTPWLRVLLREDGTRALAAAGRWTDAAAHAARFDDHPVGLREARQALIIAHAIAGRADDARALLDASTTTQPWEDAIATTLGVYVGLKAERPDTADIPAMLDAVQQTISTIDQTTTMVWVRLGLATVDLADASPTSERDLVATQLVDAAAASPDALVAREVLTHPLGLRICSDAQARALNGLVHSAGLGRPDALHPFLSEIETSVEKAERTLRAALKDRARLVRP